MRGLLLLEDGLLVEGCGFGSPGIRVGEIVFTTGMVGYPETLTDPSFCGQILVATHPLIGNYGVPSRSILEHGLPSHYESDRIWVEAFIVSFETSPSHWASSKSLHEWLAEEGVPGISNVDTRMLVKHIRDKGVMMAVAAVYPEENFLELEYLRKLLEESEHYNEAYLVSRVSPRKIVIHEPGGNARRTVVVVDCGVKYGILRELLKRGFRVVRIPYNEDPIKYLHEFNACGVVFSNGPGNPELLSDTIRSARAVIEYGVPSLGICLGHQILAIASGAETYKLKYGHRGQNKPCMCVERSKCFVTSQNHGFAVDENSLDETGFKLWMINVDDRTIEGLKHSSKPIITVQFHPEGSPGPLDSSWIFDMFTGMVEKYGDAL